MTRTPFRTTVRIEQGSMMVVFGAIVLPFLFFVFSTSLDISAYFREQEQAKRFADDAVLRAWKFLPDQDLASRAVADIATQYGFEANDYQQTMQGGDITVSVSKSFPLWFARYFDNTIALPVKAFAIATGTAFDASILVDTSNYMAPVDGTVWGDTVNWGPASFFSDHADLHMATTVSAENHTQRCFNPVLNPLKQVAADAYEFLGNFSRNAISVAVFPSGVYELEYIRPLSAGGKLSASSLTDTERGEATFPSYTNSAVNVPSWCAAAALTETHNENYMFPKNQATSIFIPPTTNEQIVLPNPHGVFPFNPAYAPHLSLRESLWSATASNGIQNTKLVLQQGVSDLLQQAPVSRGGLTGKEVKTLIILSGGFPRDGLGKESDAALVDAIQPVASLIKDQSDIDLRIYYVVAYSEELLGTDRSTTQSHAEMLDGLVTEKLQELSGNYDAEKLASRFNVKVVLADASRDALQSILGQLMLVRRNSMLSQ